MNTSSNPHSRRVAVYLTEKDYADFQTLAGFFGVSLSRVIADSAHFGMSRMLDVRDGIALLSTLAGRKPGYCTREVYDCGVCSLSSYGRDCLNNPVKLEKEG